MGLARNGNSLGNMIRWADRSLSPMALALGSRRLRAESDLQLVGGARKPLSLGCHADVQRREVINARLVRRDIAKDCRELGDALHSKARDRLL